MLLPSSNGALLTRNDAVENNSVGFLIQSDRNKLIQNRANGNGSNGIRLRAYESSVAEYNVLTRNEAFDNGWLADAKDLADQSPNCGTNTWRKNEFGTANPGSCIE